MHHTVGCPDVRRVGFGTHRIAGKSGLSPDIEPGVGLWFDVRSETGVLALACGLDRDGAIFALRNEPRDHHGVQGHSEPIPALPEFRFENRVLVLHRLKRAERESDLIVGLFLRSAGRV